MWETYNTKGQFKIQIVNMTFVIPPVNHQGIQIIISAAVMDLDFHKCNVNFQPKIGYQVHNAQTAQYCSSNKKKTNLNNLNWQTKVPASILPSRAEE